MTDMGQFLQFVAAMVFLCWALVGAHQWLRFGSVGVHFQLSRDYERACHDWQRRRLDEKQAELVVKIPFERSFR